MSKKIHSQDSSCKCNCDCKTDDALESYRQAATFDHMIFGDYDGYEAYKLAVEEG